MNERLDELTLYLNSNYREWQLASQSENGFTFLAWDNQNRQFVIYADIHTIWEGLCK